MAFRAQWVQTCRGVVDDEAGVAALVHDDGVPLLGLIKGLIQRVSHVATGYLVLGRHRFDGVHMQDGGLGLDTAALYTSSPALHTGSPALYTGSPALHTGSPAAKDGTGDGQRDVHAEAAGTGATTSCH